MSDATAPPRVWHTHSARYAHDGRWVYGRFGSPDHLRICYPRDETVPVTLTENPGGSHYGWIAAGHDEPIMVQPSFPRFKIQFKYGYESEQDAGYGRMVRLRVEEESP